jgi:hypothetical protein
MKGKHAEIVAEGILKELGYTTHRVQDTARRINGRWLSRGNDVFECIDVVAYSPSEMRLVQVTTTNGVSKRKKKIEGILPPPHVNNIHVEVWEAKKKKNPLDRRRVIRYFKVHALEGGGWVRRGEEVEHVMETEPRGERTDNHRDTTLPGCDA